MKLFNESVPWHSAISSKTLESWPDDVYLVGIEQIDQYQGPPEKCLVIADKMDQRDGVRVLSLGGFPHFIQLSNPKIDQAVSFAAQSIVSPSSLIEDLVGGIFQTRNSASEVVLKKFPFRSSREKSKILSEIRAFIESLDRSRHVIDPSIAMADEMFTNAIFGAPVDSSGKRKFDRLPRNSAVELDPGKEAAIIVAQYENQLLVGCEDAYGSLDTQALLRRLNETYAYGVSSLLNTGAGGLGCYLIIEQCTSFIAAVQPGKKTFVGGMVLLGLPARLLALIPKNIHIINAKK